MFFRSSFHSLARDLLRPRHRRRDEGTKVWSVTTRDYIHDNPATAGGVIYFNSADGKLRAVNATDGTERWTYTSEGEVPASPTVEDTTIYVATREKEPMSEAGHLIALQR